MERADSWDPPGPALQPDPVLRAFEDGVAAISRMAVAFGIPEEWAARTPCPATSPTTSATRAPGSAMDSYQSPPTSISLLPGR